MVSSTFRMLLLPVLIAIGAYFLMPHEISTECRQETGTFTESYQEARSLFVRRTSKHSAAIHTELRLSDDGDLVTDVVVIPGDPERLLIHMSGTHGVEGFAGSAIQSDLLDPERHSFFQRDRSARPTVVFVHAVNPYGFRYSRRWNEHNIDLNRNFLNASQFAEVLQWKPDQFGYASFDNVLNPKHVIGWGDFYYVHALINILKHGMAKLKKAVVTGQYHSPKGIFYGGSELEPALINLLRFFETSGLITQAKSVVIIDVHTGLGPAGEDQLLCNTNTEYEMGKRLFVQNGLPLHRLANAADETNLAQGSAYSHQVGGVRTGLRQIFSQWNPQVKVHCWTQEFGTIPGVQVLKALREENAAYHWADRQQTSGPPDSDEWRAAAKRLRAAFYLEDSCDWRRSVLHRGVDVFRQALENM